MGKSQFDHVEVEVAAIITDKKHPGSLLLCRTWKQSSSKKVYYELPSGVMQFGETFDEALEREIKTSLGLSIKIPNRVPSAIAATLFPADHRHVVTLFYKARILYGAPKSRNGNEAVGFFAKDYIRNLCLLDSTRMAINTALNWDL